MISIFKNQKSVHDETPKLFRQGEHKHIDTNEVPHGLGVSGGYCRTDLWLDETPAARSFAETQFDPH